MKSNSLVGKPSCESVQPKAKFSRLVTLGRMVESVERWRQSQLSLSRAVLVADLVEDEEEILHCGDDDLLARGEELAQVAGVLGVPHGGLPLALA